MGTEPYNFSEQLTFGLEWEQKVSEKLETILTSISAENISFDKQPEMQRSGIDSILHKDNPKIDVKTQKYENTQTGNLPIEVMSVLEDGKLGWYWTTESDMIVWVGLNKTGKNLYHKGYFMPMSVRDWLDERLDEYPHRSIPNEDWTTIIRLVPIEDFPDRYLIEFDPRLPTDKQTPQSDIMNWLE